MAIASISGWSSKCSRVWMMIGFRGSRGTAWAGRGEFIREPMPPAKITAMFIGVIPPVSVRSATGRRSSRRRRRVVARASSVRRPARSGGSPRMSQSITRSAEPVSITVEVLAPERLDLLRSRSPRSRIALTSSSKVSHTLPGAVCRSRGGSRAWPSRPPCRTRRTASAFEQRELVDDRGVVGDQQVGHVQQVVASREAARSRRAGPRTSVRDRHGLRDEVVHAEQHDRVVAAHLVEPGEVDAASSRSSASLMPRPRNVGAKRMIRLPSRCGYCSKKSARTCLVRALSRNVSMRGRPVGMTAASSMPNASAYTGRGARAGDRVGVLAVRVLQLRRPTCRIGCTRRS